MKRISRGLVPAVVAVASAAALTPLASCSDEEARAVSSEDAAPDAPTANLPDAGGAEATSEGAVPGPLPSAPRVVACTGDPCVVGFTTMGVRGNVFCALLRTGKVACWGFHQGPLYNQIGRAADAGIVGPAYVDGVDTATALDENCVLTTTKSIQCWWGEYGKNTPVVSGPVSKLAERSSGQCAVTGPRTWTCIDRTTLADGGAGPNVETHGSVPSTAGAIKKLVRTAPNGSFVTGSTLTFVLREDGVLESKGVVELIGRESSLTLEDPHFGTVELPNVTDLSFGETACAISNGDVFCWGRIERDKLSGVLVDPLPTRIRLPLPAVRVGTVGHAVNSTTPDNSLRMCAIVSNGDLYCMGNNRFGQVGDGTTNYATTPVKVQGLPGPAVDVRGTYATTCAVIADGRLFCWGSGGGGLLGNGSGEDALLPVQVKMP